MSDEKEILINDSCIFIDLIDLNLIYDFFQLDYRVTTTSMVIGEITNEVQSSIITKYISNGKLIIDSIDSYEAINLIFDTNPGLSYTDCSVLELTIRKNGIIVSSDKGLRNESKRRNLKVRGLLWIIETLLKKGIITIEVAIEKLKALPEINQRAPLKEILLIINKLEH